MQVQKYKLWTALVTPFNADGSVDYDSMTNLIKKQQEVDNGILILGSTGEGLALSIEEKRQVIKFVSDLDLTIPVMVGIGGFRLDDQLELMQYAHECDVDCFLLVTPIYAKPNVKGQIKWFASLLDKAERPCMLYNIPSRTGVALYPEVLRKLKSHPKLWALKEASGTLADFQAYRKAAPRLPIYSGNDDLMPHYGLLGAAGLVSVVSNVWPKATRLYLEKSLSGDISLFPLWQCACSAMFQVSNPIPVKVLLHEKTWIKSPALRLPLTHEDIKKVGPLLDMDGAIQEWWEANVD